MQRPTARRGRPARVRAAGPSRERLYAAEALEPRRLFGTDNPEFRANSFLDFFQLAPAVAADADGDFVVVWQSQDQDSAGGYGVYAKRFTRLGVELVPPPEVTRGVDNEFQVNVTIPLSQAHPAVAMDADGDFVVAWESRDQDAPGGYGVYARRFDAAGRPRGGEFRVNTFTPADQRFPAAAMDADGDFVIAWQSDGQDGSGQGVYARRFDADGVPRGGELRLNTFTDQQQSDVAVAMDARGGFVAAWSGLGPGVADGVHARRYGPTGQPLDAAEFLVSPAGGISQVAPSVAADYDGDFVVAWQGYSGTPGVGDDVFARRYNAAGAPRAAGFRVNSHLPDRQGDASVTTDADGDFVVGWTSDGQDSSGAGVFAKRFDKAGGERPRPDNTAGGAGNEFRLNGIIAGSQATPVLASSADGDPVAAWTGPDFGGTSGVYANRYLEPADDAGPVVTDVFAGAVFEGQRIASRRRIAPGEQQVHRFSILAVGFSENMLASDGTGGAPGPNDANNRLNYGLTRHGSDVSSRITDAAFVFSADARRYETSLLLSAALEDGDYVLTVRQALRDVFGGNPLDGNRDGAPGGGDFSFPFTVTTPVRAGPAIRLDRDTSTPDVAVDADGDFVVAWAARPEGINVEDIFAQRFNAAGVSLGQAFRVNTFTAGSQTRPTVAMDADGDFVITWTSYNQGAASRNVYARRYSASGAPLGGEFPVSPTGTGSNPQDGPSVAMDADGDFVITWTGYLAGESYGEFARRFNAAGQPQGGEFLVNAPSPIGEFSPAVAMDASGDFVVVWSSSHSDPFASDVYARRFDAAGMPKADQFPLTASATHSQAIPAVAVDADGDFVVAWREGEYNTSSIVAQRFDAAGAAQGGPFAVETLDGIASRASVTMDADGDFVVGWGIDRSIAYVRRFDAAGTPLGAEVTVVKQSPGSEDPAVVAADADGDFVAGWGGSPGIFAQRFSRNEPPAASGLPNVNVPQDAPDTVVNLWAGFEDAADLDESLTFAVVGNTNPGLFSSATVSNTAGTLTLDYAPAQTGQSTIMVRASDTGGLSVQTSFTVTVTPSATAAPRVTAVFVDGTAWTPAFRQFLQDSGLGLAAFGFQVPGGAGGAQLDELPWTNVNRVHVRFSEDVFVDNGDLAIRGVIRAGYALNAAAFAYDAVTFTATWTLASANPIFANDKVLLDLNADAGGVTDKGQPARALDGEWISGASVFPSGDAVAGGDFRFRLHVLPGDVNRNGGIVNSLDVQQTRLRQFTSPDVPGTPPNTYSGFFDVNGSAGIINALDLQQVRTRQFSQLPDGNPAVLAQRSLFSSQFAAAPNSEEEQAE